MALSQNKFSERLLCRILPIAATLILLPATTVSAQQQNGNEKKDPVEAAYKEAERLTKMLELNPTQTFYVDSTLQYNLSEMYRELEEMQMSGMQNPMTYQSIQKKWMDKTLEVYKRVFNEEQYYQYMLSIGKGKELKAERKAKEKAIKEEKKKKKNRTE